MLVGKWECPPQGQEGVLELVMGRILCIGGGVGLNMVAMGRSSEMTTDAGRRGT